VNGLSPYLVAATLAWVVAQGLKYLIDALVNKRLPETRQLYLSGGMPSAHSAVVISLVITVGANNSLGSPIFALTVVLAAITMYDAVMVRRSSGEQGVTLLALLKEQNSKIRLPRVARGHTPFEVMMGALVGVIVAGLVILVVK